MNKFRNKVRMARLRARYTKPEYHGYVIRISNFSPDTPPRRRKSQGKDLSFRIRELKQRIPAVAFGCAQEVEWPGIAVTGMINYSADK